MRKRFERSSTGAVAPLAAVLAALIVTAAQAGDVVRNQDIGGDRGSSCGSAGDACAHISGYIKAGADVSARDPNGLRPSRIVPPPLLAGAGATGQATADGANRGMVFLPVSGGDSVR